MRIKRNFFYAFFCVALLSTEFLPIEALSGLRPYHLLSPLVIFALYRYFPRLKRSSVFWSVMAFLAVNMFAAMFADNPTQALTSFGLLLANASLAIAVALMLASERLELRTLVHIALGVAAFSIFVGVCQLAVYRMTGLNLGLSETQTLQIAAGFSSGLRTEANTFAKYLSVVFLLVLPELLASKNWKRASLIALILVAGMLLSLTRSAIYGLAVTLVLVYFWYLLQGKSRPIAPRPLMFLGLASLALVVFTVFVGQFNEYATHKLATFFDTEEILEGNSSGFRLMSQQMLLDAFLASDKTLLIGNGWGQITFFAYGREWQAGGGAMITALAYGGVLSGLFYLVYSIKSIQATWKIAIKRHTQTSSQLHEGVLFALLGALITGQINGSLNAPEYWMLLGMAAAYPYKRQDARKLKPSGLGNNSVTQIESWRERAFAAPKI